MELQSHDLGLPESGVAAWRRRRPISKALTLSCRRLFEVIMKTVQIKGFDKSERAPKTRTDYQGEREGGREGGREGEDPERRTETTGPVWFWRPGAPKILLLTVLRLCSWTRTTEPTSGDVDVIGRLPGQPPIDWPVIRRQRSRRDQRDPAIDPPSLHATAACGIDGGRRSQSWFLWNLAASMKAVFPAPECVSRRLFRTTLNL
ncbi:Hypothetical predicted protein [Xyrichtys novacula]|uniref:Uncharacterized protein n=1 Tax=Xyrichtys novacula TaxID=13765 RepID=A0AAV1HQJ6_XYRNO|nr:Hypothetical predicted protein [Xyrichtys novacula]